MPATSSALAFALAGIPLCALVLAQCWALWHAPAAWYPSAITITLAPGAAVSLGAAELDAPRADGTHIALRRDLAGRWYLRNLSPQRPAALQRDGADTRLAGATLAGARQFQAGSAMFALDEATPSAMAFSFGGHAWRYDGAVLYRDGSAQPTCAGSSAASRAAALWNRMAPQFATMATPLAIGGHVHCGNRLGVPSLPPGAAVIARGNGQLRLAAGPLDDGAAPLATVTAATPADARRRELPLSGAASFTMAGARYAMAWQDSGDALILTPSRHIGLYREPRQPDAPSAVAGASAAAGSDAARQTGHTAAAITWQWRQRSAWGEAAGWPLQLAAMCLAAGMTALAIVAMPARWAGRGAPARSVARPSAMSATATVFTSSAVSAAFARSATSSLSAAHRPRANAFSTAKNTVMPSTARQAGVWAAATSPGRTAAGIQASTAAAPWRTAAVLAAAIALLAAGAASVIAQRGGLPPAPFLSLLLGATGCALWPALPGRLPAAVGAALVLAMAGQLTQLELGLATPDLSALRHYHKTAALLAAGSALAALWQLRRSSPGAVPIPQRTAEWALAALAGIALAALGAQVLWGDETGVFDMQPVELAKLALAALAAHGLALHLGGNAGQARRWLRLAAPALLFLALMGMALIHVDDYSPLILLALWVGAVALAYAAATRRWLLAGALAMLALSLLAGVWILRSGGQEMLARLPSSFYADRFQVWLAPGEHPHTGQQWLQGAHAIAQGGWLGADQLLGLRSAGLPDAQAAAIPAVQDDFAPSFFLYRHGLACALLLWCAQAAMLAGLLRQVVDCHRRAVAGRDFRHARAARFHCFALCGGAAFLFGHLLLSWGTNLAIFPVMGQPMSFLSAGGSHFLFFLCPLLAVSMAAAQPS